MNLFSLTRLISNRSPGMFVFNIARSVFGGGGHVDHTKLVAALERAAATGEPLGRELSHTLGTMASPRVIGADATIAEIERLTAYLSDLRPFWPLVTTAFHGWMREQIRTEGGFAGRPWAPLSPTYAAWKSTHAPGRGLLVFSGGIRDAATNTRRHATPNSLTLTLDDTAGPHGPNRSGGAILQYHQEGTGRLPARPLVFGSPLPPAAAAELEAIADRYVHELLGRL